MRPEQPVTLLSPWRLLQTTLDEAGDLLTVTGAADIDGTCLMVRWKWIPVQANTPQFPASWIREWWDASPRVSQPQPPQAPPFPPKGPNDFRDFIQALRETETTSVEVEWAQRQSLFKGAADRLESLSASIDAMDVTSRTLFRTIQAQNAKIASGASYVRQDVAADCLLMLEAAGFGAPGAPEGNTLYGMVKAACAQVQTGVTLKALATDFLSDLGNLENEDGRSTCPLCPGTYGDHDAKCTFRIFREAFESPEPSPDLVQMVADERAKTFSPERRERDLGSTALRALADRVRDEMPWERGTGLSALRDTVVATLHALASTAGDAPAGRKAALQQPERLRSSAPLAENWGLIKGIFGKRTYTLSLAEDDEYVVYQVITRCGAAAFDPAKTQITMTLKASLPDVLGGTDDTFRSIEWLPESFDEYAPDNAIFKKYLEESQAACREHYARWQAAEPTFQLQDPA